MTRIQPGLTALIAAMFFTVTVGSGVARAATAPQVQRQHQLQLDSALRDEPVVIHSSNGPTFMGTVARNTFAGALAGFLVGGAIWLLDTPRHDAQNVGYWTAGGALVGAALGVVQLLADENPRARLGDRYAAAGPSPAFIVPALSLKY
jgi:hypothetical protein